MKQIIYDATEQLEEDSHNIRLNLSQTQKVCNNQPQPVNASPKVLTRLYKTLK